MTQRSRRFRVAVVLSLGLVAGCAGSLSGLTPAASKGRTMHAPDASESALHPQAALSHAVLAYLDSLHRPADVSLDRFRTLLHAAPGAEPGFAQQVADAGAGWTVTVGASSDATKALSYHVSHEALNGDDADVDVAPVCDPDFDATRAALLAMGFQPGPSAPDTGDGIERGARMHSFSRGTLFVEASTLPDPRGASPQRTCLRTLDAGFVAASDEAR